jgi:aryl-alcohol dehydrogenase-like predicted oxidoreductase
VRTRRLGRTDVRPTEVTLGTWGLSAGVYGQVDEARFEATVARALDEGITAFDMSPTWGEDGASERVVARVVAGRRDECTFITRAGVRLVGKRPLRDASRAAIERDVEDSLRRLRTDRIDVLLLNHPDEMVLRSGVLREAGEALVAAGKVRAYGASVSTSTHARLAIAGGAQAICLPYNLLWPDDVQDLGPDLAIAEVGLLARSPLLYGALADTWLPNQAFGFDDHRRRRFDTASLRLRVRAVTHLRFLWQGSGFSAAEAAIRWVLSTSLVTTTVVGARSPAQAASAARAASGEPPLIPEDDLLRVTQVLASLGL